MAKSLLTETRSLLKKRNESRRKIADATGLGYEWLIKVENEVIKDPSVLRIEKLHRYLSGVA